MQVVRGCICFCDVSDVHCVGRQRKVKCQWPSETADTCEPCAKGGRKCAAQIYRPRASVKVSSRDRISRLEQQLASISAKVQNPQNGAASSTPASNDDHLHSASVDGEEEEELPTSANPPAPLRLLFDAALTDLHGRQADLSASVDQTRSQIPARYLNEAREKLQRLLPHKRIATAIMTRAMAWVYLYQALYPPIAIYNNPQEMLTNYERFYDSDADPISMAAFLLSLSISAHQLPPEEAPEHYNPADFIRDVSNAVEATILSHDSMSGTTEGIEITILYMRLQLGRGRLKSLWLQLRKTIALAEYIGMPRAAQMATDRHKDPKAILFETLCATDRMAGLMLNLPMATNRYKMPPRQVVGQDGVDIQAFLFQLVSTAASLQDIDDGYATGEPQLELYEKILRSDQQLRMLAASVPKLWWRIPPSGILPDYIVQCFYHYLMARLHLNCALKTNDQSEQFAYSRSCCMVACQALASNYTVLRRQLPRGFFVGRIFDMQTFVAVVFLCLARHGPLAPLYATEAGGTGALRLDALISDVLKTMNDISDRPGADFARDAVPTVNSLKTLLDNPSSTSSRNLTLRVPLLGSISIGRKGDGAEAASSHQTSQPLQNPTQLLNPQQDQPPLGTDFASGIMPPTAFPAENDMPWMMLDVNPSFQDPYLFSDLDLDQLLQSGMDGM